VDMVSGCLRCTYCNAELVEEQSAGSKLSGSGGDSRSVMARFNDEIEPIYVLLRKVEDIRLSSDILEPEPSDYRPLARFHSAISVCTIITIIIKQHLYSAMTSLEDTGALMAPARSVQTGGF